MSRLFNGKLRLFPLILSLCFALSLPAASASAPSQNLDIEELVRNNYRVSDMMMTNANGSAISGYSGDLSSWAVSEVSRADEMHLIPAAVRGNFTQPITRQDFCKLAFQLLYTLSGVSLNDIRSLGAGISFSDCNEPEVAVCAALGIVNGYPDGTFLPNNGISRQEAAKVLTMTATVCGYGNEYGVHSFTDVSGLWSEPYLHTLSGMLNPYYKNYAVMQGVGDGIFDPYGSYTREQAIMSMYRLCGAILDYIFWNTLPDLDYGIYRSYGDIDGSYHGTLYLYSDQTFLMEVDQYDFLGNVWGYWDRHNQDSDILRFYVSGRDFSDRLGARVEYFEMYIGQFGLIYWGVDSIGAVGSGDYFAWVESF